jgi:hypothetical protein
MLITHATSHVLGRHKQVFYGGVPRPWRPSDSFLPLRRSNEIPGTSCMAVPQLPTAAAWVRSQIRSCEIRGGQSGTGAGFLRVLRLPLPIIIPYSSIIRGWYNMPISGRRTKWTQSHSTPLKTGSYGKNY